MAKGKDIKGLLGKKSPSELRKGVQQIDILQEAAAALTQNPSGKEADISEEKEDERKSITESDSKSDEERPNGSIDKKKRITKTHQEADRINRPQKSKKPCVFSGKDVHAVLAIEKRQTERYSFEIYSDQKKDIEHVCDLYEKATGKKLSASRLIREVLDTFLPDALKTFEANEKEISEE